MIAQKHVVAWQGEPQEFGQRVQAEARRRGLAQAQAVFVVAEGSVWIWNVQADRFAGAQGVLDFYHASEHWWAVAHALYPADATAARGCPVSSGARESFCAQLQGRFKRCGQFWSRRGLGDLMALEVARRNLDWDALWSTA